MTESLNLASGAELVSASASAAWVLALLVIGALMALILTEADFANLSLLESPELERRLADATRVPSDAVPEQLVTMNTMIRYRDITNGTPGEVQLVYPQDARSHAANRISVLSQGGLALLGASIGQVVECELAGDRRPLRIEGVVHQPERAMREFRFLRE